MTVASTTNRIAYQGNGTTGPFAIPFKFLANTDIRVFKTMRAAPFTVTELVLTTDFTLTGAGADAGGAMTLVAAVDNTFDITILRDVDALQGLDLVPNDPFPADSLERALDKLAMCDQRFLDLLERSLSLDDGDTSGINVTMPPVVAGSFLRIKDDKTGFEWALSAGVLAVSAFGQTLLNAATAAAARALLLITAAADQLLTNLTITTKGDMIVATAANTVTRKAAPADGRIRMADSAQSDGWQDVPFALGMKNAIINGAFNVWQRGTSFVGIASASYSADRWTYVKSTTAVHDVSRSTDVPTVAQAERLFNYSILVDCQTADAAVAAGDFVILSQYVEGYNFLPLAQKTMTLSFWVKATKTGIYCVSFKNSGADRSYVGEYTINAADTWEKKTITVTASPSAGTWDYTNGVGLRVNFCLMAGATYQTAAGAWAVGDFNGSANQVNACDNIANNFRLCGVQLETGSVATAFEARSIQTELELCKRYYELWADSLGVIGAGYAPSTSQATCDIKFMQKRVAPTPTVSNMTHFSVGFQASSTAVTGGSFSRVFDRGAFMSVTTAAVLTVGDGIVILFANAAAKIAFDAEL